MDSSSQTQSFGNSIGWMTQFFAQIQGKIRDRGRTDKIFSRMHEAKMYGFNAMIVLNVCFKLK